MEDWATEAARRMYPHGQVKQEFPTPHYTAVEIGAAKRELVLDLLESKKLLANKNNQDTMDAKSLVRSAQLRAIRLTKAWIDWRQHKVRSKSYKGLLGVLYDEFKRYQCKDFIEV